MNFNPFAEMPAFVQKEMEKLNEKISPFMKKASRYALFSFPLIVFSIMNLVILIFAVPYDENMWITVGIYAVLGAVGMALSKESKIRRKEIEKMSMDYIIERINKSEHASEQMKTKYVTLIKEKPITALAQFTAFLQEERRRSYY
ncbi:uncharacterized protein DUF5392 [Cytobacillus horneckiae]|uniref:Uncharacterized protein n=1 Tax=Cytobacillus horneckiae TaxID=549687 RepID=A0A2N0ZML3_9BACI|nr:DUF5392 family protein [Cytobacillus horneckiae]MBN6886284.1 DUF5392 family protein [Cytobacillus horneckiae]MCM3176525.1 YwnF family protein [Cytobacillus horneckiae]MEC1159144.1 DUF5392 family protein [Cytobacillus horneckiae]MED2938836.1 DUF5392 family protein [Cytobacillus horneckiae]PKG30750.1 hypothetical protein CWS20_01340 [Cytobacillus horneckiae]